MPLRLSLSACALALVLAAQGPALAQDTASAQVTSQAQAQAARPTLVVTLVVDQFSANLFNQYRPLFTGGMARLSREGRVHINGYQQHGLTETCPGHSTMLTGMNPATTGITANDWVSPETGLEVYCLAEPANHLAHGDDTSDNGPVGPRQMTATTLADWLKEQSPESRVFAVSGKDRGAITLNGHRGDGAYWFTGVFGLTTYVEPGQTAEERLAPVAAFNAAFQGAAAGVSEGAEAAPQMWTGAWPQCQALAADWTIRGRTFHSQVPPLDARFDDSPLLDEATVQAALHLLETQQLGRRGVVDMLGVSLSATDRIGHRYGTQGPEMCEQMMRLDAAVGQLLDALPDTAIVVLTADHGGSDFVERLHDHGYPHARRTDWTVVRSINAEAREQFGLNYDPITPGGSGLMIGDAEQKALAEPLRGQILALALERLRADPDMAFAESRDVLLAEPMPPAHLTPDRLSLRQRYRLSMVAGRSPDIIVAAGENVVGGGRVGGTIANHGTPWDYDRRVPILFWWPGADFQERFLPIRTIDIAPTLANLIGVETPPVDGRCITLLAPGAARCATPAELETSDGH